MTRKKVIDIPNVRKILQVWLRSNGFDGLCSGDCGCFIDYLIPCSEDFWFCEPGTKKDCEGMEIIGRSKKK
jgi:hypothetical protein